MESARTRRSCAGPAVAARHHTPVIAQIVPLPSPSPGSAVGFRVLVVDDSVDACESLAAVVQMLGHTTRTAFDGQQAVEVADEFRPQLIIMDISLPKLNGYEAAAQIRERCGSAGTVFVALTGWGRDEDRRDALAAGFQHHVTKPIDFAQLRQILDESS
jgi:CheY-like chemotaxis protein